ncbi:Plasmodium vivax Vir protein, putative [Plasmodium ovale]|uniref:Plasmodium vivax Vir protein, putative n=1 Tax=Plasmodium ovale TaxID=36330 RepID=A0A1C3KK71_PLAOA|nr:Plasmodium vivax Vir protein, putative [Plasmodium ovale]
MEQSLGKDDLPSIKYFSILKESLNYEQIEKKIDRKEGPEVYEWSVSLYKTLDSYVDKYILKDDNTFSKKRCIDLIYILDLITLKINKLSGFDANNMIQGNINNFINSSLKANGCDMSSRSTNNEDVSVINNKKKIHDLCEDISFIEPKIDLLNTSSKCKEINDYIKENSTEIEVIYEANPTTYFDVLKYNGHTDFNKINATINKIKCLSDENPHTPPSHTIIPISFTLVGFVLISFLLYRLTPLKPWLHNMILRKKNILNNINGEDEYIPENISEYLEKNSSNSDLHVLYKKLSFS